MTHAGKADAVLYVKDLARVAAFYARVPGLEVQTADGQAVVESSQFPLVVLQVSNAIASTVEITRPPVRRVESPIKLVFFVASIAAVRERAAALGGALNPVEREWLFQDHKVCDDHDPEGNVVQFREVRRSP